MYFDTHAHYDDEAFDEDRYALLDELGSKGVELIIDPATEIKSCRRAMELSERYPFLYFAAGWHPEELESFTEEAYAEVCRMAEHEKCAAVGEIGLDYYWDTGHKEEQKALFRRQAELAIKLGKPVIVHDREAHGDSMEIISDYPELRGVFHCYSGSAEMAKELLKRGWYLGFDGPVTYKNARKTVEVMEMCPSDRFLIETDSPYMSPVPVRGTRNNSANLRYIAEKIAEIRGISPGEAARLSLENGKRLFGIK